MSNGITNFILLRNAYIDTFWGCKEIDANLIELGYLLDNGGSKKSFSDSLLSKRKSVALESVSSIFYYSYIGQILSLMNNILRIF